MPLLTDGPGCPLAELESLAERPNSHGPWIETANACRAEIARLEEALAATTGRAGSGSPPDDSAEPRS